MSDFSVLEFDGQTEEWDRFIDDSNNGTIFHKQKFLEYHQNRFKDIEHGLVFYKKDSVCALMPLAILDENGTQVARSPYGASYGGLVTSKPLNYADSIEIINVLLSYLRTRKVERLDMTLPIAPAEKVYSDTFRLALHEQGFILKNRDISSSICLDENLPQNALYQSKYSSVNRKARKALKNNVKVVFDAPEEDFWKVMDETFAKLNILPTHTADELSTLISRFPKHIKLYVAYSGDVPVSALGVFDLNSRLTSTFYIANDPKYQELQGLSLLILEAAKKATEEGFKWMDFGTSSYGMKGRGNIFRFKESFGAIGSFRESFTIDLGA